MQRSYREGIIGFMSFTVTKSSQIRGWKNQVTHPRHATWKIILSQIIFLENVSQIAWVTDTFFDHLGPFWAHLDPFTPFQAKMIFFCPKWTKQGFGAKYQFLFVNVKNRSKFHEKMAIFCHFLAMNGKLWAQKKFSTHIQCQR